MKPMKPCTPWLGLSAMWMLPALMCSSVVGVTSACMISTLALASSTAVTAPSAEPASGIHIAFRFGLACRIEAVARLAALLSWLVAWRPTSFMFG